MNSLSNNVILCMLYVPCKILSHEQTTNSMSNSEKKYIHFILKIRNIFQKLRSDHYVASLLHCEVSVCALVCVRVGRVF